MLRLDRVHQTYVLQIGVHFEQVLSQILWGLEVLQVSCEILRGVEILAFRDVSLVLQDDDLIDLVNRTDARDLAYEICSKGRCLRELKNRIWETDCQVI